MKRIFFILPLLLAIAFNGNAQAITDCIVIDSLYMGKSYGQGFVKVLGVPDSKNQQDADADPNIYELHYGEDKFIWIEEENLLVGCTLKTPRYLFNNIIRVGDSIDKTGLLEGGIIDYTPEKDGVTRPFKLWSIKREKNEAMHYGYEVQFVYNELLLITEIRVIALDLF